MLFHIGFHLSFRAQKSFTSLGVPEASKYMIVVTTQEIYYYLLFFYIILNMSAKIFKNREFHNLDSGRDFEKFRTASMCCNFF